ncbi:MAG: DUF2220 family protein [Eubacteriales bacterium]|nr:DUF2220 family protein [Eubacteriales bacterium]
MKRYDDIILDHLLDKYEASCLYEGKNQRNLTIAVKLNKNVIPEYFDQTKTTYAIIDDQLKALEQNGLIQLVWGKCNKHIIEQCRLNVEAADRAYAILGRIPKRIKEQGLEETIAKVRDCSEGTLGAETVNNYLRYIEERLHSGKSVKAELDINDLRGFENVCSLLNAIECNKEECFLRELSVKAFRDSKIAEKYIAKAVGVLRRFSKTVTGLSSASDMSDEEILEEYGVFRNPSWIMLKGSGDLRVGNADLNLEKFTHGIGMAGIDAAEIKWHRDNAPTKVLTIENLTSFHRFIGTDILCVYLGGFADRYQRSLLKNIYEIYPDSEYIHFGDIDCGGFYIWKALCEETGIPFGLTKMDSDTYSEKYTEGKPLSENDRKRLEKMKTDPFFRQQWGLFDIMLEKGFKIEQECIELALI